MASATTTALLKVAWIRDAAAPIGQPAFGRLNCRCGNAPLTRFEASQGDVHCACGQVYSWNGYFAAPEAAPAPMKTDLTVANIIAQQIGRRAFFMMGTRQKLGGTNFLSFDIRGSRLYSKVQVTLEPSDTYKVEFFKFRKFEQVRYACADNVYADSLHQVISKHTGVALSL